LLEESESGGGGWRGVGVAAGHRGCLGEGCRVDGWGWVVVGEGGADSEEGGVGGEGGGGGAVGGEGGGRG